MQFNLKLEDIKYLKITYKDSQDVVHTSKSAIKQIDSRELLICIKFQENLKIPVSQDINISIICNDGLYKTCSNLKYVFNEAPYTFLTLELPKNLEYQQNREYFRIVADYNCVYRVYDRNFQTKIYDLSANGISIFVPEHIIDDSSSTIFIDIDKKKMEIPVNYVRSEKIENGYKISFSFKEISENNRDFISQVCIKKQLEEKRNSIL